jgi:hypothetical protein
MFLRRITHYTIFALQKFACEEEEEEEEEKEEEKEGNKNVKWRTMLIALELTPMVRYFCERTAVGRWVGG